jgi:hypothetical protein|tara:strand:+ start:18740 stop:18919 length:180 start_codon:yes stop_codon:yes gene_type:complete
MGFVAAKNRPFSKRSKKERFWNGGTIYQDSSMRLDVARFWMLNPEKVTTTASLSHLLNL